jgi:UDP-N-acetylmuramate dehydrogenase
VGSFFQNAIVSASFARTLPPECPRWPVSTTAAPLEVADRVILASYDGYVPPPVSAQPDVKVSAAWLIEHSGLRKGSTSALACRPLHEARPRPDESRVGDG